MVLQNTMAASSLVRLYWCTFALVVTATEVVKLVISDFGWTKDVMVTST